ncbi:MAG TPA: SDR family NAD(P)-dependent oxidoreductase [Tepidisphaeraceae bacterium]|nr:SDR family NAD(P)-dependent oxidoreductase [Tepidisphaeraceae bacterium]
MEITGKVAIVTGAGRDPGSKPEEFNIGSATAVELANRDVKALGLVDRNPTVKDVAAYLNEKVGREIAYAFIGDTTDPGFRREVYDRMEANAGIVRICVPAAGITRDRLAVKLDKQTGQTDIYPEELFRLVTEVNLVAPVYWALEMVARIAKDRRRQGKGRWEPKQSLTEGSPGENIQGTIIFIGSVSSQGNKGQIVYAATKAGLEGAARTLMKEAMFYGIRCGVIHPGFTNTPMVRALGQDYIGQNILPYTQLRRLIYPEEIASAICFMIANSALSGELWADAGWHPSA